MTEEEAAQAVNDAPMVQIQKLMLLCFNTICAHYPGTMDALMFWRDGDALHIIGARAGASFEHVHEPNYEELQGVIADYLAWQATHQQKPESTIQ